jgi:DUF1009 family protein
VTGGAALAQGRAVGLIAGNGQFPILFARGARRAGLRVLAVGLRGETQPELEAEVDALIWVWIGQLGKIIDAFKSRGVSEAAFVGGIGKLKAFRNARPDWRMLKMAAGLRSFTDDALLRALAGSFEREGVSIIPSTQYLQEVVAIRGRLAGRLPTPEEEKDIALGRAVGEAIGRADVGQTVVVQRGHVIAVEAAEGTDACIRRAGELAGAGVVVVKRCKPGQDERFDLPAVGPKTIETLSEAKGAVLAIESGRTLILEGLEIARRADRAKIAVVAW